MTAIERLAQDARPKDDADWGTERQIDAENLFFEECGRLAPHELGDGAAFYDKNLKASSEERIDAALGVLRRLGISS